jgi:hypothetical protein
MLGPESNPFDMYGSLQVKVNVKGLFTSVHVTAPGNLWLQTGGNKYFLEQTSFDIEGLLTSAKVMLGVGTVRIFDLTNKLVAVITYDADKSKRYGYLSSFIMGTGDKVDPVTGVSPHRRDLITIEIFELMLEDGDETTDFKDVSLVGQSLAKGYGSYLE